MLGCQVQLCLYYSTSSIGVNFLSWTALHVHTRLLFVFLKDGTSQLGLSSYFSVCVSSFPFLTFLTPHKGREECVIKTKKRRPCFRGHVVKQHLLNMSQYCCSLSILSDEHKCLVMTDKYVEVSYVYIFLFLKYIFHTCYIRNSPAILLGIHWWCPFGPSFAFITTLIL